MNEYNSLRFADKAQGRLSSSGHYEALWTGALVDRNGHCGKSVVIGPRNACGLSAARRKEKRYNASAGLDMPDAASGARHDADFFA